MSELKIFQRKATKLSPSDNVAVALVDLSTGARIDLAGTAYDVVTPVHAKHKFALEDLPKGSDVVMYGVVVGEVTTPIRKGERISTENLRHRSGPIHPKIGSTIWEAPDVSRWRQVNFQGYRRKDGQVGTRNCWLVVPLVFCENKNLESLQRAFGGALGDSQPEVYERHVADLVQLYKAGRLEEIQSYGFPDYGAPGAANKVFPNVDGVRFLTHTLGCGGTREDARSLCGIIAGYIHNPNVAGATILSLGCQNAQASILREEILRRNPNFDKPLFIFDQQQSNLESQMLQGAIRDTFNGLIQADKARRSSAPLSALTVGLKCGGSDGFSGISANPAIGHTSDLLCALGGRTILSEFPELCGAEQNLVDRCVNSEIAEKFLHLMKAYSARAQAIGSGFDSNPSPGNIRDGLITDAMKSAGAARKGGTSPVTDVLDYPEYSTKPGLNLLCTPGSDLEAVSAQVGAGANIVLFTTGLGTPAGNAIAPVLKISTNSELAARMSDIIDLDTGAIVRGAATTEEMGEKVLDLIVKTASGEVHAKAEDNRQEDFIPWKRGVSL
jgi:altronate hydrolase